MLKDAWDILKHAGTTLNKSLDLFLKIKLYQALVIWFGYTWFINHTWWGLKPSQLLAHSTAVVCDVLGNLTWLA